MFRRSGLSVITSHPAGKHILINFLLNEAPEVAVRVTSDTSRHKNLYVQSVKPFPKWFFLIRTFTPGLRNQQYVLH